MLICSKALIRSSELFHNKQDRDIGGIYTSCKGVVSETILLYLALVLCPCLESLSFR